MSWGDGWVSRGRPQRQREGAVGNPCPGMVDLEACKLGYRGVENGQVAHQLRPKNPTLPR